MSSMLIIGTGFAGIGMAIRLKQAGIDAFTILERADDVGGTWRDNDYPGCACDVQSHLYSFSFEPNPNWTRLFAKQSEILGYLRHCVDKYGIRKHIRFGEKVPDAALRARVTPDYTIGCKRILLSDDWYPALSRENVNVVTDGIRELTERGVVTEDGQEHPVDAIIYGTGFQVQTFIPKGRFFGRGGVDVVDTWKNGPEAYKSTTIAGFPNLFLLAGPNSGLGHTSMVFMIESQIAYVLDALKQMRDEDLKSVEVQQDVQTAFNAAMQQKHKNAVWQTGCKSWYLDANGRNTTIWPDFTFRFRRLTARFDAANYRLEPGAGIDAEKEAPSRLRRPANVRAEAGELV